MDYIKCISIEECDRYVGEAFPEWTGLREGSCGHWSWYLKGTYEESDLIAQALLNSNSKKYFWKLKIGIYPDCLIDR